MKAVSQKMCVQNILMKFTSGANGRKKNGGNYFNSDGRFYAFVYEYRTDGKKIQVRSGKYKAEACCHKDDTYNEEIGLFLASNRLFIKILQDMVNSEIQSNEI